MQDAFQVQTSLSTGVLEKATLILKKKNFQILIFVHKYYTVSVTALKHYKFTRYTVIIHSGCLMSHPLPVMYVNMKY